MRTWLGIVVVVGLSLAACGPKPAASARAPSPAVTAPLPLDASAERIAAAFYATYRALPSGGGVPDEDGLAMLAPFVSPALDQLLSDADAAETAYAKATKGGSPPLIEGDPFTSLFEGATEAAVATCAGDDKERQCTVDLAHADKSGKPTKWRDTTDVVRTDKGWRVDDIEYGGPWEFANKGRLTELLKGAIEESRKPVE